MPKSALLVADVQNGVVDLVFENAERKAAYLERLSAAIAAARQASIPVIYCVITLRKGRPEVKPNSPLHRALDFMGSFLQGEGATDVHPSVAPREADVVVHKCRVSAFAGNDLEIILRSQGVENILLVGLSTAGVVLSTLCQASDLDFNVTVLEDLCAELESEEETHKILVEKVFQRQAVVVKSQAWIDSL